LKVTASPALAIQKASTRTRFFPVCVIPFTRCGEVPRPETCSFVPANGKIGGFFWKNKIELHSSLRIKCSKCSPLFRKHNRSLLSKFSNTDFSISGVIPSQILFILFFILIWSVHSHKQYFLNNLRRKNPADLNLVILEVTRLVLFGLSNDGL